MDKKRCEGVCFGTIGYPQCTRKASFERDGKAYCKTHYPSTVQANKVERDSEFKDRIDSTHKSFAETQRRANAFPRLLQALEDVLEDWQCGYKPEEVPSTLHNVKSAIATAKEEAS
jgi:hypothetical protein